MNVTFREDDSYFQCNQSPLQRENINTKVQEEVSVQWIDTTGGEVLDLSEEGGENVVNEPKQEEKLGNVDQHQEPNRLGNREFLTYL